MTTDPDDFVWRMQEVTPADNEAPAQHFAAGNNGGMAQQAQHAGYATGPEHHEVVAYQTPHAAPQQSTSVVQTVAGVAFLGVAAAGIFFGGQAFGEYLSSDSDSGGLTSALSSDNGETAAAPTADATPTATETLEIPETPQGGDDTEGAAVDGGLEDGDLDEIADLEDDLEDIDELDLLKSVPPTAENPTGAIRYAIFQDGTAYLRGFARDEEAIERLTATFAEVFGAENVVNEYEIDPGAPRWTDAPMYFEDVVLFDVDSSVLRAEFVPLLYQTRGLLDQGPFVTLKVIGKTDASGTAEHNERLAAKRAQTVVDYFINELGADSYRVDSEVLGESDSTEDASEDEAARERRVEVVVSGLRG